MPNYTVDTDKGRIYLKYDSPEELEKFLNKRFKTWEIVTKEMLKSDRKNKIAKPKIEKTDLEVLAEEMKADADGEFYVFGHSRASIFFFISHRFGKRLYTIEKSGAGFVIKRSLKFFDTNIDLTTIKHVQTITEMVEAMQTNNVIYTETLARSTIFNHLRNVRTRVLENGILITKK
jgi:hypothetical protein